MTLSIITHVLAGNMGEGWDDARAAAEQLAERVRERLEQDYPGAQVEVRVQHASGAAPATRVWSDDIDPDLVRQHVAEVQEQEWERLCRHA